MNKLEEKFFGEFVKEETKSSGYKRDFSFVYFILDEHHKAVKIGYSVDPERRLLHIKASNLNNLKLLGSVKIRNGFGQSAVGAWEKKLHVLFEKYCIYKEWFKYTGGLKSFIHTLFCDLMWEEQGK